VKFAWIEQHRNTYPVRVMCLVLDASVSGYYAWRERKPSAHQQRQEQLVQKIRTIHANSRKVYGSPRVHRDLLKQGEKVCENTVAKLMRRAQIRSVRTRRFVPRTTDSRHAHPVAANVLNRNFTATQPNQKWVCDITYLPTTEGWLYLAATLDLYSRKIVGWSMGESLGVELVSAALTMALARRHPPRGLLHHSDRGVQYACGDYQAKLAVHGLQCSMSRTGDCYDNAAMESFWGTLKTEMLYPAELQPREQTRLAVFDYVEVFYNRVRMHSSLGYVSPEAFEAAHR